MSQIHASMLVLLYSVYRADFSRVRVIPCLVRYITSGPLETARTESYTGEPTNIEEAKQQNWDVITTWNGNNSSNIYTTYY